MTYSNSLHNNSTHVELIAPKRKGFSYMAIVGGVATAIALAGTTWALYGIADNYSKQNQEARQAISRHDTSEAKRLIAIYNADVQSTSFSPKLEGQLEAMVNPATSRVKVERVRVPNAQPYFDEISTNRVESGNREGSSFLGDLGRVAQALDDTVRPR